MFFEITTSIDDNVKADSFLKFPISGLSATVYKKPIDTLKTIGKGGKTPGVKIF